MRCPNCRCRFSRYAAGVRSCARDWPAVACTELPESCPSRGPALGRQDPHTGPPRLTAELHLPVVQPRSSGVRRTAARLAPTPNTGTRPSAVGGLTEVVAAKPTLTTASSRPHSPGQKRAAVARHHPDAFPTSGVHSSPSPNSDANPQAGRHVVDAATAGAATTDDLATVLERRPVATLPLLSRHQAGAP